MVLSTLLLLLIIINDIDNKDSNAHTHTHSTLWRKCSCQPVWGSGCVCVCVCVCETLTGTFSIWLLGWLAAQKPVLMKIPRPLGPGRVWHRCSTLPWNSGCSGSPHSLHLLSVNNKRKRHIPGTVTPFKCVQYTPPEILNITQVNLNDARTYFAGSPSPLWMKILPLNFEKQTNKKHCIIIKTTYEHVPKGAA